jgi:hypothetical protein
MYTYFNNGRAIAEAVSRWLPTAAARVRARVWQVGFVGEKWRRGRFSPSTSVSPAKILYSTSFSIIITIIYIYKRKLGVPPIGEGSHVMPLKGAKLLQSQQISSKKFIFLIAN